MKKIIIILLFCSTAYASPVTIDNVPAYSWYHGCSPTAVGMVLGYWDMNGYDNLFDATGSDVFLTANVQDHISSPEHNYFYDPKPDRTGTPPPDTSIADFMGTSEGSLSMGSTYVSRIDDGARNYAAWRGYTDWVSYNTSTDFQYIVDEIDAGRPLVGYVASGTSGPNHSVPIIGYDLANMLYGFYTGWGESESIMWQPYRGVSSQWAWGVRSLTYIRPGEPDELNPVPEPSTLILFGVGLLGLAKIQRKR